MRGEQARAMASSAAEASGLDGWATRQQNMPWLVITTASDRFMGHVLLLYTWRAPGHDVQAKIESCKPATSCVRPGPASPRLDPHGDAARAPAQRPLAYDHTDGVATFVRVRQPQPGREWQRGQRAS